MLLIVDDNTEVRRLLRSLVEDIDADIRECSDGAEAILACAQYSPNWIFMDVKMDNIDGLTATRRIKSFRPSTRIVIVTDFADSKTRQAAIEAGADGFCGKDDLRGIREIIGDHGHLKH